MAGETPDEHHQVHHVAHHSTRRCFLLLLLFLLLHCFMAAVVAVVVGDQVFFLFSCDSSTCLWSAVGSNINPVSLWLGWKCRP